MNGRTLAEARRRRADRARQVADVLRHQVLAGAFPAGQLPRESQLCHDYEASRNTVREALGLLAAAGLVERLGARTPHELMCCVEVSFIGTAPRWRRAPHWCAPKAAGASTTLDVRRADVAAALHEAGHDPDADVRAYARRALTTPVPTS